MGAELARQVFRELIVEADELSGKNDCEEVRRSYDRYEVCFRLSFDGAYNAARGAGGTGWLLEGPRDRRDGGGEMRESSMFWEKVAHGAGVLSGLTEVLALTAGLASFFSFIAERGGSDSKLAAGTDGAAMKAHRIVCV